MACQQPEQIPLLSVCDLCDYMEGPRSQAACDLLIMCVTVTLGALLFDLLIEAATWQPAHLAVCVL